MDVQTRNATFISRRSALRTGLNATAGLLAVVVVPGVVKAADVKLAKSTVQYVDAGNMPHIDCDDCVQFLPGKSAKDKGQCKIVEGDIDPHGHCLAFSPKPKP
jgi:hypothetical protein